MFRRVELGSLYYLHAEQQDCVVYDMSNSLETMEALSGAFAQ